MSKKQKNDQLPDIPWKHEWAVSSLGNGKQQFSLSLPEDCMVELADFLDIVAVKDINCDLVIKHQDGQHLVHVHGDINANIVQECAHSLEPISVNIKEEFDSYFADCDQAVPFSKAKKELFSKYGVEDLPVLDEEEDPEPIVNGKIDLGGVIVQFLSLSIDPYPHNEDNPSSFEKDDEEQKDSSARENPFAALKDWNKKKD